MTRKEKKEIKGKINLLCYQLRDINYKLESIETAFHYVRDHFTDEYRYYGMMLSGNGINTPLNLPADYICNILAYGEPFLRHKKKEIEEELQTLKNQLEEND